MAKSRLLYTVIFRTIENEKSREVAQIAKKPAYMQNRKSWAAL